MSDLACSAIVMAALLACHDKPQTASWLAAVVELCHHVLWSSACLGLGRAQCIALPRSCALHALIPPLTAVFSPPANSDLLELVLSTTYSGRKRLFICPTVVPHRLAVRRWRTSDRPVVSGASVCAHRSRSSFLVGHLALLQPGPPIHPIRSTHPSDSRYSCALVSPGLACCEAREIGARGPPLPVTCAKHARSPAHSGSAHSKFFRHDKRPDIGTFGEM